MGISSSIPSRYDAARVQEALSPLDTQDMDMNALIHAVHEIIDAIEPWIGAR